MRVAVGSLVQDLAPDAVVLGGGMIETLREEMVGAVIQAAQDRANARALDRVRVLVSSVGDEASISGAAWLAHQLVEPAIEDTKSTITP